VFDVGDADDDGQVAERRFDPTKLVLLVVVLVVVVGVFIAFRSLFSPVDNGEARSGPEPTDTIAAPPAEGEAPADPPPAEQPPAEEPAPPAGAAPVVVGSTSIDPSDGDGEHQEAVALPFDGDPSTFWYTQTYNRPEFGGLKEGVGFQIQLAAPSTISGITIKTNSSGGNVEVRSTDAANPSGGTLLVASPVAPDTVLTFAEPVETGSIVLWFTSLPQAPDGRYRVEVTEIGLS
jgi:hypothetical protein